MKIRVMGSLLLKHLGELKRKAATRYDEADAFLAEHKRRHHSASVTKEATAKEEGHTRLLDATEELRKRLSTCGYDQQVAMLKSDVTAYIAEIDAMSEVIDAKGVYELSMKEFVKVYLTNRFARVHFPDMDATGHQGMSGEGISMSN